VNVGDTTDIIAVFLGLIALPITYFFGKRNRQLPELRYAIDFDIILKPDEQLLDHGLSMTIGNREINCISRSRIAFWNQRGDTVRGADMPVNTTSIQNGDRQTFLRR